jgi:hypothetical protein
MSDPAKGGYRVSIIEEHDGDYDDKPQWYWAVLTADQERKTWGARAGENFIVACGQGDLWRRAKAEFGIGANCSWLRFGPKDGDPTLADCTAVFLVARESYGVAFNRAMMELARIAAWANCVDQAPGNLCDYVSNPTSDDPLPRGPYRREDELALQRRIAETLGTSRRAAEYEDD